MILRDPLSKKGFLDINAHSGDLIRDDREYSHSMNSVTATQSAGTEIGQRLHCLSVSEPRMNLNDFSSDVLLRTYC